LAEKNRLTTTNAQAVEHAFAARLAAFADQESEPPLNSPRSNTAARPKRQRSTAIDKSVLAWPEPRRLRDREHVKHVAKQVCLICGRRPCDAHHLRFAQSGALGRKVSDEFMVPLCRGHHREVHRCGDEAGWWHNAGLEPLVAARALWLETHPLPTDSNNFPTDRAASAVAGTTDRVKAKGYRRVGGRRTRRKTESVEETVPHGVA
jgi:hypothetical protein